MWREKMTEKQNDMDWMLPSIGLPVTKPGEDTGETRERACNKLLLRAVF